MIIEQIKNWVVIFSNCLRFDVFFLFFFFGEWNTKTKTNIPFLLDFHRFYLFLFYYRALVFNNSEMNNINR